MSDSQKYDGYHLNGIAGSRHLTYRAIKAVQPITAQVSQLLGQSGKGSGESADSHRNYPHARNMHKQVDGHKTVNPQSYHGNRKQTSYAESVKQNTTGYNYSVPTQNRFSSLN